MANSCELTFPGSTLTIAASNSKDKFSAKNPANCLPISVFQTLVDQLNQLFTEWLFFSPLDLITRFRKGEKTRQDILLINCVAALTAKYCPIPGSRLAANDKMVQDEIFYKFIKANVLDLGHLEDQQSIEVAIECLLMVYSYDCGEGDNRSNMIEIRFLETLLRSLPTPNLKLYWSLFIIDSLNGSNLPLASIPIPQLEDELQNKLISISSMYREITRWLANGGRNIETYPPWNVNSSYNKFSADLSNFEKLMSSLKFLDLSLDFITTKIGIYYHLSVMFLERSYFPFLPHTINHYNGPTEPPLLPPAIDDQFWSKSSMHFFDSAKILANILPNIQLHTPSTLYAVFSCLSACLYGQYFPWMDISQHSSRSVESLFQILRNDELDLSKIYLKVTLKLQELYSTVIANLDKPQVSQLGRANFKNLETTMTEIPPTAQMIPSIEREIYSGNMKLKQPLPSNLFNSIDEFLSFFQN